MKLSTEFKVGILAVIAITALVLGFDFLKGNNTFNRGRNFYVVYDRVPGVQESDPVKINDLLVGRVKELKLQDDYTIIARLNITNEAPIPEDTRAMISSSDLLGAKQIDLVIGQSSTLAKSGDELVGTIEIGLQDQLKAELQPITERFISLVAQVDSTVAMISTIFSGKSTKSMENSFVSVSESLDNFRRTSGRIDNMVAEQTNEIDSIFTNLAILTASFADNAGQFDKIFTNMATITDSLAALEFTETVSNANIAIKRLNQIITQLEDGKGSLGLLLKDEELYNNLNASSEDLDLLLKDIKENPRRYVTLLRIGSKDRKAKKEDN
ncbi:MAG: phospholipid/cholesterol/gamma-HCH transport system substrate-binding protein [Limisphaerales bacterium]|jgi:phospholipid/cholesterol/gamma-HCH transport system substrate-binding protein